MPDPSRRLHSAFLSPSPLLLRRSLFLPSLRNHSTISAPSANFATPCASLQPNPNHTSSNPATQYVPLHVHSDFSLLDGASQLPTLVKRAQELGVPALALTDHGVLYGAIQLVRTCSGTDVKPIIGNEMYVVNDIPENARNSEGKTKRYHLIVLAKNTVGYGNLVKLTTLAHLEGSIGRGIFARPCITKAQLFQYREGLIVSSACLGGEIPQAILNDDIPSARMIATWFRDVFDDDFYLEIQDHGSDEDKKVNPVMVQLSRELGIKVIATNDSHFTSCLDAEAHDALICIQTGKLLTDDNRLKYAGNEFFKSVEEMRKCFTDHLPLHEVDQALYNTMGVAEKVGTYELFGATRIPDFPVPTLFADSKDRYLKHISHEGLRNRLDARILAKLADPKLEGDYFKRLEHELDIICQMGFSSYFLVVWDYIRHAKHLNIPVGPGRGSAAGSLVAFALRITDVDPITFNLLFERFLNPERKSMPDIDTDFSVSGREKIIAYVTERYGSDRVAQIITFNRLTSKAVLKDVARVHNVPYSEADRLAKMIPVVRGKPATLTKLLSKDSPSPDFRRTIERNPPYKVWLEKAQRIEGTNKTYGIHAAGVVISASPLTDIVPLSKARHGETITQYAMEDVEALGLLKMDFLGLKNLSVIETALEFINEGRRKMGIEEDLDFSVDALPLDDAKTYKLLAEGELDGIFQLDASAGMRSIVRELRPSSLEDISSVLALYRPGPLDAGLIPKFIRRKHGVEAIVYDHPLLEPILQETYGIMVYQEQIMRIARDLAGYTFGEADILRRAMGKKKVKDMEREKPRFVNGAQKQGVAKQKATELFDMMTKFAEYCFNKSHSTAYAYLTYQTAYLKANYPVEYSAALLRANMNQSDKLVRYLADAHILGVKVLPPSVNMSEIGFTVDRSGSEAVVRFGLGAVKTVGGSVSKALIEERTSGGPFVDIIDLIGRVDLRSLNKRAMGALIQAGAFDEMHQNRKVLMEQFETLLVLRRKLRDRRNRKLKKELSPEALEELAEAERLSWEEAAAQLERDCDTKTDFMDLERLAGEKASMGFYASGHPLVEIQELVNTLGCTSVSRVIGDTVERDDVNSEGVSDAPEVPDGAHVMILSCVTDLKKMTTAKGKKMAKWMIEDSTGRVAGVVFPGSYALLEQILPEESNVVDNFFDYSKDAENFQENADLKLVVEEDARVIVWGKVDRESSGTAQIIVDDVQRVEHVNAVIASARCSEKNTPGFMRTVLRHVVSRSFDLEPSDSASGTYKDKNGELRRRRRKATPLDRKHRVPLVLRCLSEHGTIMAYEYVGNAARLPANCENKFHMWKEETGFDFQLVNVTGELLAQLPGTKEEDTTSTSELLKQTEGADFGQDDTEQKLVSPSAQTVTVHQSTERDESASFEDETIFPISSNTGDVEANEASFALRNDEGDNHIQKDVGEIFSYLSNLQKEEEESAQRAASIVPDVLPEEGLPSDLNMSLHGPLNPKMSEEEIEKLQATILANIMSPAASPNLSRREAALYHARRPPYQRDTFFENEFYIPPRLEDLDAHPVYRELSGNDQHELFEATEMPSSAVGLSTKSSATTACPPTRTRDALERHYALPIGGAEHNTETHISEGISANSSRSGKSEQREASVKPFAEDVHDMEQSSNELQNEEESLVSGNEDRSLILPTSTNPEDPPRVADFGDVKNGLAVRFDEEGLPGVLDAICFVAGGVARKYSNANVWLCAMTELDVSKLTESGVRVEIEGHVVFVNGEDLFVRADIREQTPSGRRKRVRSFGPVFLVYKSETAGHAASLKTKKARKEIETAAQEMAKAANSEKAESSSGEQTSPKRAKKVKLTLSSSMARITAQQLGAELSTGCDSLRDGGQVLRFMSRTAVLSIGKALGTSAEVRVVGIDRLFCEDMDAVRGDIDSIKLRTHMEGTSFGTVRVQVLASVVMGNGDMVDCRATFRVAEIGSRLLKTTRVVVDEDPLFDSEITSNVFSGLANVLSSTLT